MTATYKVTVALDFANLADAKTLVSQLNPEYCNVKVGKEEYILVYRANIIATVK